MGSPAWFSPAACEAQRRIRSNLPSKSAKSLSPVSRRLNRRPRAVFGHTEPSLRGAERRSNPEIAERGGSLGLLRFARNDVVIRTDRKAPQKSRRRGGEAAPPTTSARRARGPPSPRQVEWRRPKARRSGVAPALKWDRSSAIEPPPAAVQRV